MRTVTAFFAGFAAGFVCLGLLVWRTHAVPTATAFPPPPQIAPTSGGAPAGPTGLMIPVEGVTAADLHDNFVESRSGHRHDALDILAPRGTPVRAVAEGNVAKLFPSRAGGLTVYQFDDRREWCFYYAHLDRYAPGLTESTLLRQGQVLGYVGTSGNAPPQTPHLHFAIFKLGPDRKWWEGTPVNPYPLLTRNPAPSPP